MAMKLLVLILPLLLVHNASAYVGGMSPAPGQFPFTVALPFLNCTAAKVGPKRILTAAHCLANRGPFAIYEVGDKIELMYFKKDKLTSIFSTVAQVKIHPSYMNRIAQDYDPNATVEDPSVIDLAIIDLKDSTPIPTGAMEFSALKTKELITVGGFGCQSDTDDIIGRFQARNLSYKFAEKKVASIGKFTARVNEQDASGSSTSTGCEGDSGGPVYKLISGTLKVVGVNSYLDAKNRLNFTMLSTTGLASWLKD